MNWHIETPPHNINILAKVFHPANDNQYAFIFLSWDEDEEIWCDFNSYYNFSYTEDEIYAWVSWDELDADCPIPAIFRS